MENKLLLYRINTDYIRYLKQFQRHIWDNDDKGFIRPYVGVVLRIYNHKYYVPLSSPKQKHKRMKDSIDFIKITYKDELKAVLNINNIIPVDDSDITLINIDQERKDYRNLLNIEMKFIRKNSKVIVKNARMLYNKIVNYHSDNKVLAKRCYDFRMLESKLEEYKKINKRTYEQIAITTESTR